VAARVLFVCLGNICRSPTAHAVFQHCVDQAGEGANIGVDSAGTIGAHIGNTPDSRATQAALARGYDLSPLRARQVNSSDFERFDYILAMDEQNLSHLRWMQPQDFGGHLGLFLEFHPQAPVTEVPDPYYGDGDGFNEVLDLVEEASQGLLRALGET